MTMSLNIPSKNRIQGWTDIVPSQYHDYEDIFTRKDFDKLQNDDLGITLSNLTPGFKPVDCKTYPLSRRTRTSKGVYRRNLAPDELSHHPHPCITILFCQKKDGKLRPTQDYRKAKRCYDQKSLSASSYQQTYRSIGHCQNLSKNDVRWGYNNICIKEGDEWKAAFRTNIGLFEPTVMFSDSLIPRYLPIIYERDIQTTH